MESCREENIFRYRNSHDREKRNQRKTRQYGKDDGFFYAFFYQITNGIRQGRSKYYHLYEYGNGNTHIVRANHASESVKKNQIKCMQQRMKRVIP